MSLAASFASFSNDVSVGVSDKQRIALVNCGRNSARRQVVQKIYASTLFSVFSPRGKRRSREMTLVLVDISKQSGEQSWRKKMKRLAVDRQVNVVRVYNHIIIDGGDTTWAVHSLINFQFGDLFQNNSLTPRTWARVRSRP